MKAMLKRIVCCVMIAASVLVIGMQTQAIAAPAGSAELSRAENEFERVVGEGAVDRIQGRAQEDIGKVQRSLGSASGQVEGAANQIEGRAQRDLGRTQKAIDDAGDAIEDKADNLADSVKSFFGN